METRNLSKIGSKSVQLGEMAEAEMILSRYRSDSADVGVLRAKLFSFCYAIGFLVSIENFLKN